MDKYIVVRVSSTNWMVVDMQPLLHARYGQVICMGLFKDAATEKCSKLNAKHRDLQAEVLEGR
jgi:hypothetical protein